MALFWPDKDPDEVLDYKLKWTARVGQDAIAASQWIVPSGMTSVSDSFTGDTTTIWLSGGLDGTAHSFVNKVTTESGRVFRQKVRIRIRREK